MSDMLLEVDRLTMRFGGLIAVEDLAFSGARGRITALIGPNGAGKTTVFNCLTGFYRPTEGRLTLYTEHEAFNLEQMTGHRIAARARVARTFQNIRLFPRMTALENLIVATQPPDARIGLHGGRADRFAGLSARRGRSGGPGR